MPRLSADNLNLALHDAFIAGGALAVRQSLNVRSKPWNYTVNYEDREEKYSIFIWTITHGGGPRDPDEFRIQMTGVTSPLYGSADHSPLLLGYFPERKVFAGFNFYSHRLFGSSPSIQILRSALILAETQGISVSLKSNGEKAFGIRPDHLLIYASNHRELHDLVAEIDVRPLLITQPGQSRSALLTQVEALTIPEPRKKVLRETLLWSRDEKFKKLISSAYGNRCAVSKVQLRLVDAAHVLPVSNPQSTDLVTNGIMLSPTFHRAYDTNLIYLDYVNDNLKMLLNERQLTSYSRMGIDGNVSTLRAEIATPLHLPQNRNHWPSREMVALAKNRIPTVD